MRRVEVDPPSTLGIPPSSARVKSALVKTAFWNALGCSGCVRRRRRHRRRSWSRSPCSRPCAGEVGVADVCGREARSVRSVLTNTASLKLALLPDSRALVNVEPAKDAAVALTLVRLALVRLAACTEAWSSRAPLRFVPVRSTAPPEGGAERIAPERFAPFRYALSCLRSPRWRCPS